MKKILFTTIAIFLQFYLVPLFAETWNFQEKKLQVYSSDRFSIVTDLPESFALPYLEYTENFAGLVYEFLAEIRDESPELKGKIILFARCEDYKKFLLEQTTNKKNPFFFRVISQKSWSQFEIAGCLSTQNHFIKSIQNEIASRLIFAESENTPPWFAQGLVDYLTYANYIHDDLNVIPYYHDPYILTILQIKRKKPELLKLKNLFLLDNKIFYKNRKQFFPLSWAFIFFLMDRKEDGRKFLTLYYKEHRKAKKTNISNEELFNNLFLSKNRPAYSEFDQLEKSFLEWIESMSVPRGYEDYIKSKKAMNYRTKIEFLQKSIEASPTYYAYYEELADINQKELQKEKALDFAQAAIDLQLQSKKSLEIAISSSYELNQFSITEFYLNIYLQFYSPNEKIKSIQQSIQQWRKSNPEIPNYYPDRLQFKIVVEPTRKSN
jgi:hypothetical protein